MAYPLTVLVPEIELIYQRVSYVQLVSIGVIVDIDILYHKLSCSFATTPLQFATICL